MPCVFNFLTKDRRDYVKSVRLPNTTTIRLTYQTAVFRQCELVPLGFREKRKYVHNIMRSLLAKTLTWDQKTWMVSKSMSGSPVN